MSEGSNPYAPPEARVEDRLDPDVYELAGRGQRLGAAIIDGILGFVVSWPIFKMIGVWSQVQPDGSLPLGLLAAVVVIGLLVFLGLHGYFLKKNGQTIGKKLLGIRIVNLDNEVPEFGRLIGLRYVPVMVVSVIPLVQFLSLVDILFIFRGDRRCVHDLIAGTRVVVAR